MFDISCETSFYQFINVYNINFGPVWFILYMNDILSSSNLPNITMYADDSTLSIHGKIFISGIATNKP